MAAVGADVEGALDYDGDIDFFRFQAERGQSYQIDVALGTLDDSIVDLYDVGWSFAGQQRRLRGHLWPRASIGKLPVLASITLQWRASA